MECPKTCLVGHLLAASEWLFLCDVAQCGTAAKIKTWAGYAVWEGK